MIPETCKTMQIIVCVDDGGGMSFGGRRQSQDRYLRAQVLKLTEGTHLWMNGYSAGQFEEGMQGICVAEDFLDRAGEQDWCFVETGDLAAYAPRIRRIAVYRWNRHYPASQKFPFSLFEDRWTLESCMEFAGFSHERITREVYRL